MYNSILQYIYVCCVSHLKPSKDTSSNLLRFKQLSLPRGMACKEHASTQRYTHKLHMTVPRIQLRDESDFCCSIVIQFLPLSALGSHSHCCFLFFFHSDRWPKFALILTHSIYLIAMLLTQQVMYNMAQCYRNKVMVLMIYVPIKQNQEFGRAVRFMNCSALSVLVIWLFRCAASFILITFPNQSEDEAYNSVSLHFGQGKSLR